jgi:dihydroorotate dehydrogenase (fumarate)
MDAILGEVRFQTLGSDFDVKVSPYSNPAMIPLVAGVLKRYGVRHVVTSNTFPNGIAFKEDGKPAISVPSGYAGIAGNALHHIALGQVAQFREELHEASIGVIGVGGVTSGERLLAMHRAGAVGVQIGTGFGKQGGKIFSDVIEEALALEP